MGLETDCCRAQCTQYINTTLPTHSQLARKDKGKGGHSSAFQDVFKKHTHMKEHYLLPDKGKTNVYSKKRDYPCIKVSPILCPPLCALRSFEAMHKDLSSTQTPQQTLG